MDERIGAALGPDAAARLERVRAEAPDAVPACAAWLGGVLLEKNTYSWADGSVPEAIQSRLDDAYWAVGSGAQSDFGPWLWRGFEAVREGPMNDLARWRMER